MKNELLAGFGQVFIAVAVGILAVVIFIIGMAYLPVANKFLDLKARQDCAISNRLDYTDKNSDTVISRPVDDLYAKCLTEKGI